jgi:two-component system, NtrC family, response regulator HydG
MSEKVLVVDDERQMVNTICDILGVKGYETIPAYSGEEAVAKAITDKPDCVLMDIRMPGIDGVSALKKIREAAPALPVLLMSAYATGEQMEEAKQQGAYAVLTKPIDIQGLLSFLSLLRKEESVMVVDDDPLFCMTIKDILEARGYLVKTEIDPGKVLGHLEPNYNLMILLDLKLGGADGVEVLKDIRAKYPSKPVVLVTGFRDELTASIKKGMQMGAYACLYKPFEIEELVGIIEEICQKKLRQVFGEPF